MQNSEYKKIKSFKDLMVWQKSSDLAVLIYKITENFPHSELYGIVDQMRRAVVSISSNIAEGFRRNHKKEKIQFYNIAHGSVTELESQIEISNKLHYIDKEKYQMLLDLTIEVSKMISGLMQSTNRRSPASFVLSSAVCFVFLLSSFFSLLTPVYASDSNGTIDPSYKYAWGENLGWLNFVCDGCNVHVTDTGLTGYTWSRQYGWINLTPSTTTFVTNNCSGQLGGYAWSSNLGWINFTGATIDMNGKFTNTSGVFGSQTGRIRFNCDNCDVRTDWRQCALRPSPPQVIINAITNTVVPTIVASTTMTNEGTVGAEYPYEWCVVSDISNECGGGDDVFYSSAAKFLNPGESFYSNLSATVPTPGNYYFKLVAHYGAGRSVASVSFTATGAVVTPPSGGGGGGSYFPPPESLSCNGADFNHDNFVNSIDFSILLYYWKMNPPYKNVCVDINSDKKVNSVDFSILLSQWGKRPVIK